MSLVVFAAVRHHILIAVYEVVHKRNARYPVAIPYVGTKNALYIILLSGEIPHKIAEIHPVSLINDKVFDVVSKVWVTFVRAVLLFSDV